MKYLLFILLIFISCKVPLVEYYYSQSDDLTTREWIKNHPDDVLFRYYIDGKQYTYEYDLEEIKEDFYVNGKFKYILDDGTLVELNADSISLLDIYKEKYGDVKFVAKHRRGEGVKTQKRIE